MNKENEQLVSDFIKALQDRKSFNDIKRFYHEDVQHVEFPNALTKNKTVKNLEELLIASERGKSVLTKEVYEILKIYSAGDTVIIEAIWTGTLAIPLGNIAAGGEMKACFAQIFEFKDGKIYRQRNYDCFEPFN